MKVQQEPSLEPDPQFQGKQSHVVPDSVSLVRGAGLQPREQSLARGVGLCLVFIVSGHSLEASRLMNLKLQLASVT